MTNKKIDTYQIVNIEALCNALTESDWVTQTGGIPHIDLYETIEVEGIWGPEIRKEVRAKWCYLYYELYNSYMQLVQEYVRK